MQAQHLRSCSFFLNVFTHLESTSRVSLVTGPGPHVWSWLEEIYRSRPPVWFLCWEHLLCRDIQGGPKQVHVLGAAALPGPTYTWLECFNYPVGETALGSCKSFTLPLDSWHLPFIAVVILEVILLLIHGLEILLNVLYISYGFLKFFLVEVGFCRFFFPLEKWYCVQR